jgi:hypothetical protein
VYQTGPAGTTCTCSQVGCVGALMQVLAKGVPTLEVGARSGSADVAATSLLSTAIPAPWQTALFSAANRSQPPLLRAFVGKPRSGVRFPFPGSLAFQLPTISADVDGPGAHGPLQ